MTVRRHPEPAPRAHGRPGLPGRPKDPGKRAAILDAAKQLFVQQGYAGTSVEQIAATAGVSKLTVYSHFGDKETLFVEAVKAQCMQLMPEDVFVRPGRDLRGSLLDIARHFFALVSSEPAVALHRVLMADGRDDPKLVRLFWDAGPARVKAGFTAFLEQAIAAGQLEIPDTALAVDQFLCLLKGPVHMRILLPGLEGDCACHPDHVEATVDLYLRAYAPRGVPAPRRSVP